MTTENLLSIAFPLVLGLIMLGLGTSLTISDFANVKRQPKAILIGLGIQMLLGPLLAFAVIQIFSFPPYIALGFLLLSVSPGGPTSNLYSLLARGDVALNVSLTAINSVLGLFYIPLFMYAAVSIYFSGGSEIPIPYQKIMQTILIVLIPVAIGMWLRMWRDDVAHRLDPWIRRVAVTFIVILAAVGLKNEWRLFRDAGVQLLLAVVVFNLGNLFVSYVASRQLRLSHRQSVAITFEVGIHNCILAMTLAISPAVFGSLEMAMPAVLYSIVMQFSAGLAVRYFNSKSGASDEETRPLGARV